MAVAPEPFLSACMATVRLAVLDARQFGYALQSRSLPDSEHGRVADLMDAVHNIPELVLAWERCNEPLLRSFLEHYDKKWRGSAGFVSLLDAYERELVAKR